MFVHQVDLHSLKRYGPAARNLSSTSGNFSGALRMLLGLNQTFPISYSETVRSSIDDVGGGFMSSRLGAQERGQL